MASLVMHDPGPFLYLLPPPGIPKSPSRKEGLLPFIFSGIGLACYPCPASLAQRVKASVVELGTQSMFSHQGQLPGKPK